MVVTEEQAVKKDGRRTLQADEEEAVSRMHFGAANAGTSWCFLVDGTGSGRATRSATIFFYFCIVFYQCFQVDILLSCVE